MVAHGVRPCLRDEGLRARQGQEDELPVLLGEEEVGEAGRGIALIQRDVYGNITALLLSLLCSVEHRGFLIRSGRLQLTLWVR